MGGGVSFPAKDLLLSLSGTQYIRVVSPHGIRIVYQGEAKGLWPLIHGEIKKRDADGWHPKIQREFLNSRMVRYARRIELDAEDWADEFLEPQEQAAFLKQNKGKTFVFLFIELG